MVNALDLTNPDSLVTVTMLNYFEAKIKGKYATKEDAEVPYASNQTCEDIITELV